MSEIKNENPASSIEVKNIKKLEELSLDELSLVVLTKSMDFNDEDNKRIARKFLEEIAKKENDKTKIEDADISSNIFSNERKALKKVTDSVKTYYDYKEVKEAVIWFTWEELEILQNFMEGKELIVKQTKENLDISKKNVTETIAVKEKSKEEREELKTSESNWIITWTFWSEKNKWEQWKNVNELSLSNILEQKSWSELNSLHIEMKKIAEEDNLKDWKYKFWLSNSRLENLLKDNWYKANWIFWWEEIWSIFQIIEDVVITQRTIGKKDYKEQVAIMFDNNRDCVLDNDVNFYVKEKQFFDAIKTPKNWENLLKNLWYNWKSDFDKELWNNYFLARKNFETRLATVLHQPEILLRVNPGEMLVNPNAIKDRINFTKELVWIVDKALNDPESKDIIKAKIKEIKEQNWDNSPVTNEETKSIIDQIKLQAVWIVVWTNNWAALSFDISSLTKDIVSSLNVWFINWVWWIWISKEFKFFDGRLTATWWIVNLIPYVWARWLLYKWDTKANSLLWKTNIDSRYDLWLSWWASLVGWLVALDISKTDEKTKTWIENLKKQMSWMIDEVFEEIKSGKSFEDSKFADKIENKQVYEIISSQYKTYWDEVFIKTWILNNYERELYKNSAWLKLTWIVVWLAWMLPFIWIKWEYHDTKWSEVWTIKMPWKNKNIWKNWIESRTIKSISSIESQVTNEATMTNNEREASILALEDKFSYKTRYNKWAYDFMNPNTNLETRWNWLKTLNKSTKILRDSNLSKIIADIEKTWDISKKSHLISVLSQFTRKSSEFNNGNIGDWNTKLEERKKIEERNRKEFDNTLWFSLSSESRELYSKLWKWKIWSTKLDWISFDLIASKNVEWKSLKWIELLNAKSSILTIDGKPAWVDITDKSKIDAFTKKINNANLVNWIKSWEIVLKLAKDPYGWDDKIVPIKKSRAEKIENSKLTDNFEIVTKIDVYNPEHKVIDWVIAYVWDKINKKDDNWNTQKEPVWSNPVWDNQNNPATPPSQWDQ